MNNDVELIPVKGVLPSVQVQSDNVIYVPQAHKNKAGIVKEGDGVLIENGVVSLNKQTVEDMIDANKWVSYGFKQNLTEDEKGMARHNIGAGDNYFTGSWYDLANRPQETVDFAESERQKSKNLLLVVDSSATIYNYTMTCKDGVFTINGGNGTDESTFILSGTGGVKSAPTKYYQSIKLDNTNSIKLSAGTYTISATIPSAQMGILYGDLGTTSQSGASSRILSTNITLTFTKTTYVCVYRYLSGSAMTNVSLGSLQIEEGTVATDYQPYNGAIVHEKNIFGASTLTLIYSKNSTDANLNKGKTTGIYETSGAVSIDFNEYDFALCKIRSDQGNHDYTASLFMLIPLKYGVGIGGNYTGCISVENPYNVIRRNTATINMVSIFATIPTTKDSISIFTTSHNEEQTPIIYETMAIDDIWGVKLL